VLNLYDGPHKVKKRWAIGLAALAGIAQTIANVPVWLPYIIHTIAESIQ